VGQRCGGLLLPASGAGAGPVGTGHGLLAGRLACVPVSLQGHGSSAPSLTECSVLSFIFTLLIQFALRQHGVTDTAGKRYTKLYLTHPFHVTAEMLSLPSAIADPCLTFTFLALCSEAKRILLSQPDTQEAGVAPRLTRAGKSVSAERPKASQAQRAAAVRGVKFHPPAG